VQTLFRDARLTRLAREFRLPLKGNQLPPLEPAAEVRLIRGAYVNLLLSQSDNQQAKVHLLLAAFSAPKLARVYGTVFETILNQEISTTPVVQN
jgi:hypothetical protein